MGTSSPRRRLGLLIGSMLTASLLVLGMGTAVAAGAGTVKVGVCHLDKTLGTYDLITVSTKSAHPKLPKGDFLADNRLAGKTVYAVAYTDADGVDGYSGCDRLILALVEDSDDSSPSAGDLVIFGSFPTAFSAPYGAVAFPGTTAVVASASCDAFGVTVGLGGDLMAAWRNTGIQETAAWGEGDLDPLVYLFDTQGGGSATEFSDRIIAEIPGSSMHETSGDLTNGPWLDVEVPGACA